MLTLTLVPYLYIIPAVIMAVTAWAFVHFYEENAWFFSFLAVTVFIIYPLWVWGLGAFPAHLNLESPALVVACLGLAVIGALTGAIEDGTW
jgi:hypothetical protein